MANKYPKNITWNFFSVIIIVNFTILQIIRWRILPQYMDIYYHILTAWGFIKAGGYVGWDFWQYAPVGRIHIYPPFLHIILALFIKCGVNEVILAKILETVTPIAFLFVLWHFIRKNYGERLAFFIMLITGASFSFYMGLINHIPATLAAIFGILALDGILSRKLLRPALLLSLCFYTHIGISWFFGLCVILCGLFNKQDRKVYLRGFVFAMVLSVPIVFKQLVNIKSISALGINLNERFLCQFKVIEYVLALFGLLTVIKQIKKYWLFLSLFLASFIFLLYPYRFFSAEGYLPVIFLSAVTLDDLYNRLRENTHFFRYAVFLLTVIIFIISPTVLMEKSSDKIRSRLLFAHSAFVGMIMPTLESHNFLSSVWFPDEYLSAVNLIRQNSAPDDIIHSSINMLGVTFASISRRATSNALLPEIKASQEFNSLSVSKIIVVAKDEDPRWISNIIDKYKLIKIGENKLFIFYKNPFSYGRMNIKRASVPFAVIIAFGLFFITLFCLDKIKDTF